MKKYDIAIIGAGSGGLVAAATACGMGASVLLIENRKMGGDCLNYGCVPSKTFLKSCHVMKNIKSAHNYGVSVSDYEVSLEKIMNRVKSVIAEIAPHDSIERFTELGADVVIGKSEIISPNKVMVNGEEHDVRKIIIATGSTAFIPPIKGIENIKYYTNENIFDLTILPKKMIILGAGPIGLELGQGFALLGSEVHIVDRSKTLFSKDEPEVSKTMLESLEKDGIKFHLNCKILAVNTCCTETIVEIEEKGTSTEIDCDTLLVALGRSPNTKNLGLEKIGVTLNDRGFIQVNEKLQTSVKNIYACGDVRGKYLFTHTAGYEASVAVKNALIMPIFKTSYSNVSWTTYTMPQVAHVGILEKDEKNCTVELLKISENDRSKAEDDRVGFVKVILNKKGIVVGATIVGDKAGEMISQLSIMITKKLPLSAAMSVIYQYPIQGEIVKTLAINNFKKSVKSWQKNLIKKIVHKGGK